MNKAVKGMIFFVCLMIIIGIGIARCTSKLLEVSPEDKLKEGFIDLCWKHLHEENIWNDAIFGKLLLIQSWHYRIDEEGYHEMRFKNIAVWKNFFNTTEWCSQNGFAEMYSGLPYCES